ncbi:MAG: hypothetical protein AAGA48_01995 [Myxococcota bacterium]
MVAPQIDDPWQALQPLATATLAFGAVAYPFSLVSSPFGALAAVALAETGVGACLTIRWFQTAADALRAEHEPPTPRFMRALLAMGLGAATLVVTLGLGFFALL